MPKSDLSEEEEKELDNVINDLKIIFDREKIGLIEIDDLESELKSNNVKKYLYDLRAGSKPETALREALLAGESPFAKFLSGRVSPEVTVTGGFIDYQLEVDGRPILLELKPLFVPRRDKEGKLIELKQEKLNWEKYTEQIRDYTKENEFLIFTDLKRWYFFSSRGKAKTINDEAVSFEQFYEDYSRTINLRDYLERLEDQAEKEDLDKRFFKSLTFWVNQLKSVKFKEEISESEKIESIINLINKFIFVQTLDDYSVINFQWIQNKWLEKERDWKGIGKSEILREFIEEVDKWFYRYYDTELFRKNILDHIKDDKENLENLYDRLELVLGLKHWQSGIGGEERGIINYNYRRIDEDIFGRAYEGFLADIRKEEGIYYTRKYITQYITENTVGKRFDRILQRFEKATEDENFDESENMLREFISQKVLDPACGSGSFLIKAIRIIWQKYLRILAILSDRHDEYAKGRRTLDLPVNKLNRIKKLEEILGGKDYLDLISKLILRHIYGNDKDARALSVAKINIWLEAIKLIPEEFRYDKIQKTGGYVLPDLEMNLGHGDSLFGLPEKETIEYLKNNHSKELRELTEHRSRYLKDPKDEESIEKVSQILSFLRTELDEEFKEYLKDNKLPKEACEETTPFYWGLQFWHVFDGEDPGFDAVIGNPPYERIQNLRKTTPNLVDYLNETYKTPHKNYDIAIVFTEKGYDLLNSQGVFGYIETKKWMTADYGEKLRDILSGKRAITQIVDFGDQQAFKGPFGQKKSPTTYTILLFLQKNKLDNFKHSVVKNLKHNLDQLRKIEKHEHLIESDLSVDIKDYEGLDSDPWIISSPEEKEIMNKLKNLPTLGDVSKLIFVGLQTSADPVYILEVLEERNNILKAYSKGLDENVEIEKGIVRPILKGDEIDRWAIRGYNYVVVFPYETDLLKEKYTLIDKEKIKEKYPKTWKYLNKNKKKLLGRADVDEDVWWHYPYTKNLDKFEAPKLVTQVLASSSSFAFDHGGRYTFVGGGNAGGYGIVLEDESDVSYPYLLGLLNSSFLDWRLKKESSQFRGGFYSYAKRFIEKLPVKYDPEKERKTAELVEEAVDLSKVRYKLEEKWPETSRKLKDSERTLSKILKSDKENLQTGDRERVWTIDVSFYPDEEDDRLEEKFSEFKFVGDLKSPVILIYGVDGQEEKKIFEMEFKDKNLMKIVYLSLKELLNSRKKVKKLNHIFSKTIVPVIQPNIWENTPNILKEVEKRVIEWQDKEDFEESIEPDIIEIENKLQEIENEIDAHVFNLYGLDRDEVVTVLDSLETRGSVRNDIFRRFDGLQ